MAGLSLGMNAGFAVPAPALPPSYAGTADGGTISSRAYGITAGGMPTSRRTIARNGSVAAGVTGAVFLVWLWWTLPR